MPIRFGVVRLALLVALAGGVAARLFGQVPPPGGIAQQPSAQQAYQRPATGFILGQVVDAVTGQPIGGAVVTINGGAPSAAGALPPLINGVPASPEEAAALQAMAQGNTRQMTNGSGQFVFHNLRQGNYRLNVTAPGYATGAYGQHVVMGPSRPIDLPEDGHVGDATVKLWRYAAVSGRVVDDAGEPAVGIYLRMLRPTTTGTRRTFTTVQQTATDDRGFYQFSTLVPGDYVVAIPSTTTTMPTSNVDAYVTAMTSGGTASSDFIRELSASGAPFPMLGNGALRIGDQQVQMSQFGSRSLSPVATDHTHLSVYVAEFFPAAALSAEGSVLTIGAGEKRTGVDLQLRLVPAVNISGTISGPEGSGKLVGVRLVPVSPDRNELDTGFETAASVTDTSGAFTFIGVPAGQYAIKVQRVPRPAAAPSSMITVMTTGGGGMSFGFATSVDPQPPPPVAPSGPSYFGELALSVGDHDMDGVSVTLRQGLHVSGKLVFLGAATPPTPDMLQRMSVALQPIESRTAVLQAAPRVQADGQFTSLNYPPGRYLVNPTGAGFGSWTLRSITLGGRSLDESPLELQDDDVTGIVVTFTDQATEVRGSVHTGTGAASEGDVTVFAFPSNYSTWIEQGMSGRRQRSSTTGKTGVYSLTGLPPGEYLIAAVSADIVTTRDLKFFDALARVATRLTLTEGEKKSLDLAVAPIR